jgi:hypothetical protein
MLTPFRSVNVADASGCTPLLVLCRRIDPPTELLGFLLANQAAVNVATHSVGTSINPYEAGVRRRVLPV